MAQESSKSMRRRYVEHFTGVFQWMDLFKGHGLDMGAGDDPLPFPDCKPWDMTDGDGNHLSRYVPANTFDYLHSSNSLEHMVNPTDALCDWITVVKPGGHLIITVPSWELYEHMQWPSRTNPDHKSTWSLWQRGSPSPIHVYVPDFLFKIGGMVEVKRCELVDTNFDYKKDASVDQTWDSMECVEAWIELVLLKRKL